MTIWGDGKQTRAFSYIDDVAPAIAHSGFMKKCYNQTFNIGRDHPYSVNVLAKVVAKQMGVSPKIQYLKTRNEVKYAYSDHSKSKKYFEKYISNVSLENGISKMVEWAKSKGARESKKFKKIEIFKNMPPSWSEDFK